MRRELIMIAVWCSAGAAMAEEPDPFAGVSPRPVVSDEPARLRWDDRFFAENFGLRREIMSQFGIDSSGDGASRQSIGFEALKKFATRTRTIAAADLQVRLVRRDGFIGFLNDMEGENRLGWFVEVHNAYVDFYNLIPKKIGALNARIGHFYVPFGLNLSTDTHGTILQLSNEQSFGFERDWYAGFYGALSPALKYDIYYLIGSGYAPKYEGQAGLGALRISLADKFSYEHGLEGGLSFLGGQRLFEGAVVNTVRAGADVRIRRAIPSGSLAWTTELGAGRDASHLVLTQLSQLDYLTASRRFGASLQYRYFMMRTDRRDDWLLAEVTYYFRNDVASSNLHWIKLNGEFQFERQKGGRNVIATLQYYRYW